MKRISKWLYLGSIVGGLVGGLVIFTAAAVLLALSGIYADFVLNLSYADVWMAVIIILLILTGLAAILYGASIWYLLLYKAWAAIQDENASITPPKAVGFIFIPLYNFYWIFKAWYGLSRDYNLYIARRGVTAPQMNEGMFLTSSILFICIQIPFLIYLAGLPFLVILAVTSDQTINGINGLLNSPNEPARG